MTPEARMAMLLPVDILVNHLPIHTLNDAETHKFVMASRCMSPKKMR